MQVGLMQEQSGQPGHRFSSTGVIKNDVLGQVLTTHFRNGQSSVTQASQALHPFSSLRGTASPLGQPAQRIAGHGTQYGHHSQPSDVTCRNSTEFSSHSVHKGRGHG